MKQTDALDDFVRALMPRLAGDERVVALEIYRALAASGRVCLTSLADSTRLAESRIEAIVSSWPGVFRDAGGDIVGFWGLTAQPVSKHMLRIGSQQRYAWCAWDCLFIPALLRQTAQVTSLCPQTGELIELIVSPASVEQVRPASAALSFFLPDVASARRDLISTFCHFVYFFKDDEAARNWTATRPGTHVITIDQGLQLGRMKNEWQFGSAS